VKQHGLERYRINRQQRRLIDEYASAGNNALLLARLEREYQEMRKEMREQGYLMPCDSKAHVALSAVKPIAFSNTTSKAFAPASLKKPEKNHSNAVQAKSLVK
jgi:hypothetical protein